VSVSSLQTEENTVMKDTLGKIKNSKEKHMCWQDGRMFEDKEDWVVDSCTTCTCQVGDIQTSLNGET
jgi:syndecan 4